ncbi:hypothetical protein AVEN_63210-1 [Araneus ventricosus]|uniref:Uncharacterized protein n=1 Tax=Araneus ventricosus TaxID=182803 RepID=A0A4Y2B4A7_ARAVE|nr:hypothetical protein AVEN_63210-1 [Araneus ventricosus]
MLVTSGKKKQIGKEAAETENIPETPVYLPKSLIKTIMHQKMMATWQIFWDDGDPGRFIHNILSKVSLQSVNWTPKEVLFYIGYGPFPSYLHRVNLAETSYCSCVEIGTPFHYATKCLLTASYHMEPPSERHQLI